MSTTLNKDDRITLALEAECCDLYQAFQPILKGWIKSDNNAVRYGAVTLSIAELAGLPVDRARRLLRAAEQEGRVLSYKAYEGAVIQWWPIGLHAKLSERQL